MGLARVLSFLRHVLLAGAYLRETLLEPRRRAGEQRLRLDSQMEAGLTEAGTV